MVGCIGRGNGKWELYKVLNGVGFCISLNLSDLGFWVSCMARRLADIEHDSMEQERYIVMKRSKISRCDALRSCHLMGCLVMVTWAGSPVVPFLVGYFHLMLTCK